MPTLTVENYLKGIHLLQAGGEEAVPLGKLAEELGLTPGTVTLMVQRLDGDLVTYRRREGVRLTAKGETAALNVLRRHRLIELFLVEVVGLEWHEVHEEAEALEHAISDRLIQRIDHMLGSPDYDPHGAPIPSAKGKMPEENRLPLAQARPGKVRIQRLDDESPSFRALAKRTGLLPGRVVRLVGIDPDADTVTIRATPQGASFPLGGIAARKILVTPE